MLREAIAALTTPATRHARRLGYVHEGIAIEARFRRCYTDWDPHIGRCQRTILSIAADCPQKGRVAVLGSGPLCDIPLPDLAGIFHEVLLIDIFHPPRARALARRFVNVRLVDHDLLGFEGGGPGPGHNPAVILAAWRKKVGAVDLTISANLLAQLPLVPGKAWDDEGLRHRGLDPKTWADRIMQAHVDDLRNGPGRSCLISEWRRRWYDRDRHLIEATDPLSGLALPPPRESWSWMVAPPGELPGGASLSVEVGRFDLSDPLSTG